MNVHAVFRIPDTRDPRNEKKSPNFPPHPSPPKHPLSSQTTLKHRAKGPKCLWSEKKENQPGKGTVGISNSRIHHTSSGKFTLPSPEDRLGDKRRSIYQYGKITAWVALLFPPPPHAHANDTGEKYHKAGSARYGTVVEYTAMSRREYGHASNARRGRWPPMNWPSSSTRDLWNVFGFDANVEHAFCCTR